MRTIQRPGTRPRHRLETPSGMHLEANADGALTRFRAGDLSLLLNPATSIEAGAANVHLRVLDDGGEVVRRAPLLGHESPSSVVVADGALVAGGTWAGLDYTLALTLGEDDLTWSWDLEVVNRGTSPVRVDAVLTQDPALAPEGAVANNQYYVSQYLDVTPVGTPDHGVALAVRQNMPGERVPWVVVASSGRGVGWATDAHQLVSRTTTGTEWSGLDRDLPSERLQHEHTLVALQDEPADLAPGGRHRTGFVGRVVEDHPEATGPDDVRHVDTALSRVRTSTPDVSLADAVDELPVAGPASVLATAPVLACVPLADQDLALLDLTAEPGSSEHDADGVATTWRTAQGEVVTAARELSVLRPHGQILRTGDTLVPDAGSLTTTVWMGGTFHSQVTAGHVGRDTMLTGRRSYLGLFRGQGVRVLVRTVDDTGWELLDLPSAWCNGLDACHWWYATTDGRLLEVVSRAPAERHELGLDVRVVRGPATRLLVTLDTGDDGGETPDLDLGWSGEVSTERDEDWLVLDVAATDAWHLTLQSSDPADPAAAPDGAGEEFWPDVTGSLRLDLAGDSAEAGEVAAITDAVPWFAHDALIHYLAPRGLEQYSGGGWGTRDVCQGPVGLLTALDRHDEVHDVLLRVMRAQNARGDWPQAFEFMPPTAEHGQQDSHGDVVFWPVLAVGEHLLATGDPAILAEEVPFVGDDGATGPAAVEEHLRRAVRRIEEMAVPGTPLPAYGHGDWNDSLQPADPDLARRMASTWTAVLQVQALDALVGGLRAVGAAADLADDAEALAARTRESIATDMVVDGVMPGYLLYDRAEAGSAAVPLVHPDDTRTGLTYGILPWIHAITSDVLDPEAAQAHLRLVEEHLLGPDGARLFDRPVAYGGGPMTTFQRAEASTFWGREIGLMYVHAHLRYAEALARVGDGAGLLRALSLASPWGLTDRVPQARPRQRSCYYSSSDGVFADRDDASERYADLMAGDVPLEGGWRVYSSGPGLALRLVVERLLGLRRRGDLVEVDPVLPPGADGLTATVRLAGRTARVTYVVGPEGVGVRRVAGEHGDLALTQLDNPHRRPGAAVRTDDLRAALDAGPTIRVETF
jgi:cellobiose phosphorylase